LENTAPEAKQLSTWQWVFLNSLPIVLVLIQRATVSPIVERLGLPPHAEEECLYDYAYSWCIERVHGYCDSGSGI